MAPDNAMHLPRHRRPTEFGGTGKDPIWAIGSELLARELVYRPDPGRPAGHGYLEPATKMAFARYSEAIQATAPLWRLVGPIMGAR